MTKVRTLIAAVAAAGALTTGLAATEPASAARASISCGYWRWPVKTGSDATRWQVSTTVSRTTVGRLDSLSKPSSFGGYAQNHRIAGAEFKTWQVTATLVAVRLEDDGDYHLRLSQSGHNMIAEIPLPRCVPSSSRWKNQIRAARHWVDARYWVSAYRWHYIYHPVRVRGLGFFDEEHNVTGAAPNLIELHPVTLIK